MSLKRMFPKSKQRGFLLNPFRFGGPGSGAPVTDTKWDAASKGSNVTLSALDTIATTSTFGNGSVRSNTAPSTLTRYFEIRYTTINSPATPYVGFTSVQFQNTSPASFVFYYPISNSLDSPGYSVTPNNSLTPASAVVGDVAGFKLDFVTGDVELLVNNVSIGVKNIPGIINIPTYISASSPSNGGSLVGYELRTKTAQLSYAVPAGYIAWDNI